jgi:hypothetical protein
MCWSARQDSRRPHSWLAPAWRLRITSRRALKIPNASFATYRPRLIRCASIWIRPQHQSPQRLVENSAATSVSVRTRANWLLMLARWRSAAPLPRVCASSARFRRRPAPRSTWRKDSVRPPRRILRSLIHPLAWDTTSSLAATSFPILGGEPLPRAYSDGPFNRLAPQGMTRGDFYERHFQVDPDFHGSKLPARVGGGSWSGHALRLEKYDLPGRLWYGSPAPLKARVGGLGAAGGSLIYDGSEEGGR